MGEGAFEACFERNGLHTGGRTWFEHSHVAWPDRAWQRGGTAGAVSASFDWLNLRLDLIVACSRAVHVVQTPGHPDVQKVQFPDFLILITRQISYLYFTFSLSHPQPLSEADCHQTSRSIRLTQWQRGRQAFDLPVSCSTEPKEFLPAKTRPSKRRSESPCPHRSPEQPTGHTGPGAQSLFAGRMDTFATFIHARSVVFSALFVHPSNLSIIGATASNG